MIELTLNALLRDAIDLPERVEAADFVIKLDEGVAKHAQTIQDYVVTDAIAAAVGEGLGLVTSSLQQQSSRGAFLDGSFGSGKSHYLAVLHLLLSGHVPARQIPGLEAVVARHLDTLDRPLLVLDYNLLGARSFEDAIFGGYIATVARLHPDAPAPVLHTSDAVLEDARAEREAYGDELFFQRLGAGGDTGWGDLAGEWNAETFEAAAAEAPGHPDRDRLVGDLLAKVFTGYARAGEWLPMADGLKALANHAKQLGYQGLVFLIDEVVLWLGQHLSDQVWVEREVEKVVMVGENAAANLAIPITSFLARQRALSDFLGTNVSGAQRVAQGQLFAYWEDRFTKIKLQAADLPKIVKKRLLRPKSTAAVAVLAAAVAEVKQDYAAWGYLLDDEVRSDEQSFADVYPFSPALIDTMVALSSLMQRERTALKLMAELLADGRDTQLVRDVIPVGDLYEPVALGGSEPLSEEMKQHFRISRTFYRQKMLPYLLRKHGLTEAEAAALPRTHAFVTEDRLAKTVLIAALAPEAKSLTSLTAAKLAALNYGTIDAFIPGAEADQALGLVRAWAAEFGEINVGDGSDPIISATLSGVDYDSILERVATEDNQQTRRELVRKLIAEELSLPPENLTGRQLTHVWRGHKRTVTVKFGNVRDETDVLDSDLIHGDPEWRAVIDFPYDNGSHSPADDVARLRKLGDGGRRANTIAWIPNFLTAAKQDELGKLVRLEYLLTGGRFDQNADHLAVAERGPARQTLESQRRTLRDAMVVALRQAYGVNTPVDTNVGNDLGGNEIFSTLAGLTIAPPATGTLLTGFRYALDTAWADEFPEHPDLGAEEVTASKLSPALNLITSTIEQGGRRQGLAAGEQRAARDLIVPLKLGALNENVLVVDAAHFGWTADLARWQGELGAGITVGQLRSKLAPWGMTQPMQDTVLLTWGLLHNIEFGSGTPGIGSLPDAATPRHANLPSDADWKVAQGRAGAIFGVPPEALLTPRAVGRFAQAVRHQATSSKVADLAAQLEGNAATLGIDVAAVTGRLATARRVGELVRALGSSTSGDKALIDTLVTFDLPTELTAHGSAHASAERLARELQGLNWRVVAAAASRGDAGIDASLQALRDAAAVDESVVPLEPRLREVAAKAEALLVQAPHTPRPPQPAPTNPHGTHFGALADLGSVLADLRSEIEQEAGVEGSVTISWQID
ncbi:hypothetical protein ASG04_14555 [Curtobacterium sp. Leaf183]|uniref:hypothetical protein n=1 Tax=Curtobacterium sp. Leaf183 TaxID=1736291 RepID=UPI0006F653F4|nr:hypothetical protein [Curtobacterium sp. Leaf183]KQS08323.1 hypothetical protein ASG04_14555 [Curtobacterium sp. Leaf183]